MPYFLKAIKLSLRYRWTILASVLNALLIGVLWGVSITTVYPFVEIVFEGKTIQTWLDDEIERTKELAQQYGADVAELERQRITGASDIELPARLEQGRARCGKAQETLSFYQTLESWLDKRIPSTPFGTLLMVMGFLIAVTILKGVCMVLNTVLVARVANRTAMDMQRIFYRAALGMDQQRIETTGAAPLMTLLSHNIGLVSAGLKSLYGTSIREPLKMFACLIAACMISWRLLLISLLAAPVGALLIHHLSKRMKKASLREMGGIASVLQNILETLSAIRIVRIYNREPRERCRFKHSARSLCKLSMKMAYYDSLVRPISELVGVVCLAVAVLAGAYLVLNQQTHLLGIRISDKPLTASTMFVFYAMLAGISDPARKMGDIYNVLVRAAVASRSLYTFFEQPAEIAAPADAHPVPLHAKSIRFNEVNFAYRPNQTILKKICLEIPFGQTVAVVGANGSGKTTLVNLLARFYDPQWGDIFLDGVKLRAMNPRKLRQQIGLVTQEPILFRGTIWENLIYSRPNASREEVLQASRIARVDDFVRQLPDGYQTHVGERGGMLSGGQRQRIALACAILANPRIMIFDEATSQIDRATEQLVHVSLREFLKQRTTIFVTHRLSTLELADRIIVLDNGRIVGDYSYAEYMSIQNASPPTLPAAA